jgi:hypothetical protein
LSFLSELGEIGEFSPNQLAIVGTGLALSVLKMPTYCFTASKAAENYSIAN